MEIENIDYDNKRFVFEDIGVLRLGGILEPPETQVRIFSRVFRTSKGDVVFQNFLARSTIALINIQVSQIHSIVQAELKLRQKLDGCSVKYLPIRPQI